MPKKMKIVLGTILLVSWALAASAQAPQAQRPRQSTAPREFAYNAAHETVLTGTVVNYDANATTAPLGARLTLQTGSGTLDVHLGKGSYLTANHFSLAAGDTVKIVGSNAPTRGGNIFLARVIERGSQSLAVRTASGAPLWIAGGRSLSSHRQSALRDGAR